MQFLDDQCRKNELNDPLTMVIQILGLECGLFFGQSSNHRRYAMVEFRSAEQS